VTDRQKAPSPFPLPAQPTSDVRLYEFQIEYCLQHARALANGQSDV
jgi:hypothetical protein